MLREFKLEEGMSQFRCFGFPLLFLLWIMPLNVVHAQLSHNATLVDILFEGDNVDAMCRDGNTLFCVYYDHLYSYDVNDPTKPVFLDTLDWGRHAYPPPKTEWCDNIATRDGYLYMCSYYQGIIIVDVHNPREMKRLDTVAVPTTMRLHGVRMYQRWLYVNDAGYVYAYDITQPDKPVYTSTYAHANSIDITEGRSLPSMTILEDKVYCLYGYEGELANGSIQLDGSLKIIHIYGTTPKAISSVGIDDEHLFFTYRSVKPGDQYDYLSIYTRDANDSIHYLTRMKVDIYASTIERHGNFLYLFMGAACGFTVIDISDPNNPKTAAYFLNSEWGGGFRMEVLGDYVYYNTTSNGLVIVKVDLTTDAAESPSPTSLSLSPAYPNPVTSTAIIEYTLPARQYVTLELYNALGQKVRSLFTGMQEPGSHTALLDAAGLQAGLYRCVLRSGNNVVTQSVAVTR